MEEGEPITFQDEIAARLTALREEIFGETASFVGDQHTVHTKNYYRQLLSKDLGIYPGFSGDPYEKAAFIKISPDEFKARFYSGKNGDQSSAFPELRRSHRGYKVSVILNILTELLNIHPNWTPKIKEYLIGHVDEQDVYSWANTNVKAVLEPLLLYVDNSPQINIDTLRGISLKNLKLIYVEQHFFRLERTRLILNLRGLKKLLVYLGYFESISMQTVYEHNEFQFNASRSSQAASTTPAPRGRWLGLF